MEQIQMSWRVIKPSRNDPDPATKGAQYKSKLNRYDFLKYFSNKSQSDFSDFPVRAGIVEISPFVTKTGEDYDSINVIYHELGHACYDIQEQLSFKKGIESSVENMKHVAERAKNFGEYTDADCKIEPYLQKTYHRLADVLGISPESFHCIIRVANQAGEKRFVKGLCKGGCPAQELNEAFADIFDFLAPAQNEGIYFLKEEACTQVRDSIHPLWSDMIQCLRFTPTIRARLNQWTGCDSNEAL
jgi:hypothetical protein